MQMVEVLGLPAHLGRKRRSKKNRRHFGSGRKASFFNVAKARNPHPAAHDECPEIEADDGAKEGDRRQAELGGGSHGRNATASRWVLMSGCLVDSVWYLATTDKCCNVHHRRPEAVRVRRAAGAGRKRAETGLNF